MSPVSEQRSLAYILLHCIESLTYATHQVGNRVHTTVPSDDACDMMGWRLSEMSPPFQATSLIKLCFEPIYGIQVQGISGKP